MGKGLNTQVKSNYVAIGDTEDNFCLSRAKTKPRMKLYVLNKKLKNQNLLVRRFLSNKILCL